MALLLVRPFTRARMTLPVCVKDEGQDRADHSATRYGKEKRLPTRPGYLNQQMQAQDRQPGHETSKGPNQAQAYDQGRQRQRTHQSPVCFHSLYDPLTQD